MNHEAIPEIEYTCPGHNHYRCSICKQPVRWDGVFEGKWLHDKTNLSPISMLLSALRKGAT